MGGGSEPASSSSSPSTSITLTSPVEYPALAHTEAREVLAMASLRAPCFTAEEADKRAPIDVVCVIDRSGSMAGAKLKLTQESLRFVIEQMDHRDRLGLVTYDSDVSTVFQLMKMTANNKETAKSKVAALTTGSTTNLSGGLLQGLTMAANRVDPAGVCSVILCTDGLANCGVTALPQITAAVQNKLATCPKGTSIFTMGFGADAESEMLRGIAEAGSGMYYFLDSADKIPLSFADCIGGLQSVVAQNIRLTVTAVGDTRIARILSPGFKTEGTLPGQVLSVSLGDLYSEEERDLLFGFELQALPEPQDCQHFVQLRIEYFNVLGATDASAEASGGIMRPGKVEDGQVRNIEVDKQFNRISAATAMERGRQLADDGQLEAARALLEGAKAQVMGSVSSTDHYSSALTGDLDDVMTHMASPTSYQSAGRQKLYSKAQAHNMQRSSEPSAAGMYENNWKAAAKKKAFFG